MEDIVQISHGRTYKVTRTDSAGVDLGYAVSVYIRLGTTPR